MSDDSLKARIQDLYNEVHSNDATERVSPPPPRKRSWFWVLSLLIMAIVAIYLANGYFVEPTNDNGHSLYNPDGDLSVDEDTDDTERMLTVQQDAESRDPLFQPLIVV